MKDGGWKFEQIIIESGYDPKDFIDVPFVKIDDRVWVQKRPNGNAFGVIRYISSQWIEEYFVDKENASEWWYINGYGRLFKSNRKLIGTWKNE